MPKCNHNEAPEGHKAHDHEKHERSSCTGCSMYSSEGWCEVRAPHSCCCLDRVDGCDVKFQRVMKL